MSLTSASSPKPRGPALGARATDVGGVTAWQSTGRLPGRAQGKRWRRFMWSLVYPYRANRLLCTIPGILVIAVAVGIAAAAYNTSNNILFIALSLLLACLIFSGLLSWLNLKNLSWRLRLDAPLRAGMDHPAMIELHNAKQVLPTYGLWFEVLVTGEKRPMRLPLRERLDAGETTTLEWTLRPAQRGRFQVELLMLASLFPFGFLKKILGCNLKREVLVWPGPVEYQRLAAASWSQPGQVERSKRAGQGGDLLALRAYARGDSHRLVHWKASARLRRLMVRQFAAESKTGYALWVRTGAGQWARPDQFELMCSLAATLAEDFFRAGRLTSVAVDDEAPLPIRRIHDLEHFLDRLALVKITVRDHQPEPAGERPVANRINLLTFAPDGLRGVSAYIDGEKAATA